MKAVIWKYQLEVTDEQIIELPIGSRPLFLAIQYDKLCIWIKVPSSIETVREQKIIIKGTGHDFDDIGLGYIGSIIQAGGKLVWHVFWDNR